MQINLEIKDQEVKGLLSQVARRIGDMTPAMRKIAGIMADSVEENFAAGGRPRWKESRRAIEQGGQTLQDSGRLAGSMVQKATATEAMVGTNVKYAKAHQFGAKKHSFGTFTEKVKAHDRVIAQAFGKILPSARTVNVKEHSRTVKLPWGDIPARPFLMIQDEDWGEIKDALGGFLVGGGKTP